MVTTKYVSLLGMTAALVLGAAGHADQTKAKGKASTAKVRPATYQPEQAPAAKAVAPALELGSAKPCASTTHAAPPAVIATAAPCAARSRSFCGKVWDWLTYRPVTHTKVCGPETSCTPPVHA